MSAPYFDVVVIGGGLAGLAAANRCTESGLSVGVLERGAEEQYACNSRLAMGFMTVAREDIRSGVENLRGAIQSVTRGHTDPRLAEVLAQNAGRALTWLARQGVRFIQFGGRFFPGRRALLVPTVPLRPGLNWSGRGADVMLRRLLRNLKEQRGNFLPGVRACELAMESGRCVGVVALRGDEVIIVRADAVVIADGGFQANPDLLRRYITPRPTRLLQRNAGTGTGDGVAMGEAVGALLSGMDKFYGHVQSRDAMTNPSLWPYPTVDFPITGGIAVDSRGRRFADEGLGGIFMANAIARLDDPLEATAIFDHAIWEGRARSFLIPTNPHLLRSGGTLYQASTLVELAAAAGLPAQGLKATVADFNRAVEAGLTERLEPARSTRPYAPVPIRIPPFYAVPLCAGITYTMGGLGVDGHCRVKHRAGHIIEGLFAAGCTTGGLEGGPYAAYTGGLSKALVFGLLAGEAIAAERGRGEARPSAAMAN